jgi:hypothetical protein
MTRFQLNSTVALDQPLMLDPGRDRLPADIGEGHFTLAQTNSLETTEFDSFFAQDELLTGL